jgi:hypothetical protein
MIFKTIAIACAKNDSSLWFYCTTTWMPPPGTPPGSHFALSESAVTVSCVLLHWNHRAKLYP